VSETGGFVVIETTIYGTPLNEEYHFFFKYWAPTMHSVLGSGCVSK